jgi:hypothetical protein
MFGLAMLPAFRAKTGAELLKRIDRSFAVQVERLV